MASANTHNADTARLTTDAALAFMDGHTNTPFNMNVWYVWPHGPTNPNGAQSAVYDDVLNPDDVAKRVDITKFHPTMQAKYAMAMKNHPHFDLTANMKTYLATITEIDKQIGRILAKLEALGLAQDTLVVYSSDNGAEVRGIDKPSDSSGSPMWAASAGPYFGGKFQWYDGGVRMTCLAQWKGRISAGQTNNSLWRAVDWLPTVCALAGVKTGGITLDGQNVADILLGNQRERTEPLFESVYKIKTVHEGRWKWYEHKLFDLETDVSEQNNLASQQSARAKRMLSMHSQWIANTLPLAVVTGEANPERGGITSGGAAYMVGSNAVLVATAWKGWHFTGWNDGVKKNPRTIVVPATNITYTANFERK